MPLQVFLSHASADKTFVKDVQEFLEQDKEIKCWLDEFEIGFGENIVSRIAEGLSGSHVILVFLSPTSVTSGWVREEWTAAYWNQVNSADVRLIPVLCGNCEPPPLLKNKRYVDLRTNQLEGLRKLKATLLGGRPRRDAAYPDAPLPNFIGREAELASLKDRLSQPGALVPVIGMAGVGKTHLAREFIRRHGALFEVVYEVDCQRKDLAALTGDLSMRVGLRLDGEPTRVAAELRQYLSTKRCLLLLDNVDDDRPGALVPEGRASVLVTARDGSIPFLADYLDVRPALFSDEEAVALFERVLGDVPRARATPLFEKLGHLPIAVAVAAGLIKHDVRFTIESLATDLPPLPMLAHGRNNVGGLLGDAIGVLADRERALLTAIAACAPAGVRLEFAAEVAGLSDGDRLDALQQLYRRNLVIEIDRGLLRYRLHPLIREAARPPREVRRRHAQCVRQRLEDWEREPPRRAEFLPDAEHAVGFAEGDADEMMEIALRAARLSRALGRLGEAFEFFERVQQTATKTHRQSLVARGMGGKALILRMWGRLDEAMALSKQEEAIYIELGDRASLQRSYGNQAVVLATQGRFDEAMGLYKQQEPICVELGDRAGLQRCYLNQAGILRRKGHLDEATTLLRQQEAMCIELGLQRDLGYSLATQGLLARAQGDHSTAREKLDAALAIFAKLNMPRELDAVRSALDEQA